MACKTFDIFGGGRTQGLKNSQEDDGRDIRQRFGITNGYITCHMHYPKENNSKTHIFWIINMNICMYMHLSSV